ncbi:MAG: hypothetical protein U9O94_04545 [Nanoarchaeota archaeon]|nr:hypothetical protein [Nanoarchaeota archaeon]
MNGDPNAATMYKSILVSMLRNFNKYVREIGIILNIEFGEMAA